MSHLKSGRFRILRGAMNLLKEPYEMMFHPAFYPAEKRGFRDNKFYRSTRDAIWMKT
jgi:hypothetical protein